MANAKSRAHVCKLMADDESVRRSGVMSSIFNPSFMIVTSTSPTNQVFVDVSGRCFFVGAVVRYMKNVVRLLTAR